MELVTYKDIIVIPQKLQKYAVKCYHLHLLHPGLDITEATIHQNLYCPGPREEIQREGTGCDTCQRTKRRKIVNYLLSYQKTTAE